MLGLFGQLDVTGSLLTDSCDLLLFLAPTNVFTVLNPRHTKRAVRHIEVSERGSVSW